MLPRGFSWWCHLRSFWWLFLPRKALEKNMNRSRSILCIKRIYTLTCLLSEVLQYAERLMILIWKKQYCLSGHAQHVVLMWVIIINEVLEILAHVPRDCVRMCLCYLVQINFVVFAIVLLTIDMVTMHFFFFYSFTNVNTTCLNDEAIQCQWWATACLFNKIWTHDKKDTAVYV